jgi:hypothetical protein
LFRKTFDALLLAAITLLVGCDGGGSGGDSSPAGNLAPSASAGADQAVSTGSVVMLQGAGTDPDGDTLSFSWSVQSQPAGSAATLSDPSDAAATFTPDEAGTYVLSLIVSDGTASSSPDTVEITATDPNTPPVADAGAIQNVTVGTLVSLDGSASTDPDGDSLAYRWTLAARSGSSATLSDTSLPNPTFTPDLVGSYAAELVVNDGTVDSAPSTTTVTAEEANVSPVADAGLDQNISTGTSVTLDGTGSSDSNGDSLTYAWTLGSSPAGSSASLDDAGAAQPTFVPDLDGDYVFSLVVNDGTVDSSSDSVTITASTPNSPPNANAGVDQDVLVGEVVQLDGTGSSDVDGDAVSYSWTFNSVPSGSTATFDNPALAQPSFTADVAGTYVAELVVSDALVDSAPDSVMITAVEPRVRLFRDQGFFGGFTEVALPYSSTGVSNQTILGSTTTVLDAFRLQAEGQSFTLINVSAVDQNGVVTPFIDGINESLVLLDGETVDFDLVSPLTGGATAQLVFRFEIQETGETFQATYTLITN